VLLFVVPPAATLLWLALVVKARTMGLVMLWAVDAVLTVLIGVLVVNKCWPVDDRPADPSL
jgi:hypothetical protein